MNHIQFAVGEKPCTTNLKGENMIEVNNKFEIGEEVYTGIRVPVKYKCPICEGDGKFLYNSYEVSCSNCCGSGKLHNAHQFLLEPVKVEILLLFGMM